MQEFSHADQERTREAVERFEELVKTNQKSYFDVHQIETIFDFYHEESNFDKADMAINMGINLHPTSTSLQLKKSTILIEQFKDEEALEILNYLKKLENTNAEVFLNLGLIKLRMGKRKKALSNFNKALRYCGKDELADYIFEIGFTLNQESYYKDAKRLLEFFLKRFPENENILFELAYAYDKLLEIDKGIETYNKLLDVNPYLENAWYNLGILHNKQNEFQEAINAYDFTLAIAPNLSEAYYNKANSLAQIGEFIEAIGCYSEYISYSYPTPITYYYIGDCWENLGDNKMASRFYQFAVDLDPDHIDALQSLGRTSYQNQDYNTSIDAFDKALAINPDSPELWRSLGKSYKKIKNSAEAKRCLKRALINRHEDTKSWIEMYQFLEESEENFNPIPFLKLLLSKDQSNGALHYLAAIIYNKSHMHSEALRHLVIARQLLPSDLELVLDEYPLLVTMPEIAEYINSQL